MSNALESRRKDLKTKLNAIETSLIKAIDTEAQLLKQIAELQREISVTQSKTRIKIDWLNTNLRKEAGKFAFEIGTFCKLEISRVTLPKKLIRLYVDSCLLDLLRVDEDDLNYSLFLSLLDAA